MSIKDELRELEQVSTIATGFAERSEKAFGALDAMAPPVAELKDWIGTPVNKATKCEVRVMAKAWRISGAALLRFAIFHLCRSYEFDGSQVLLEKDYRAMGRMESVQQPFITASEAKVRRRKPLVFAKHLRGDDSP